MKATLTKKDLLEAIEDMPDGYEDSSARNTF